MDLNLEPTPEDPVKKKQIAMAVAVVAVLALGATLFSHSWLRAGGGVDFGFSPLSMKGCIDGACESLGNGDFIEEINQRLPEKDKKSKVFSYVGWATFILTALAMVFLVISVVMVAQGKFIVKPMPPPSAALMCLFLALIVGCVFVATNPTRGTGMQFGVGWAFWVFGIGTVTGIAGAQLLAKFKPVEPDLF